MSYVDRPESERPAYTSTTTYPPNSIVEYYDRARWVPILSGLVVAIGTQLVLSAFGTGIGFTNIANSGAPRSNIPGVSNGIGIWTGVSFWLSLLIGGWVTARSCGPMNRSTAILNGAILWGTTLTIGSLLLASGISGAFGAISFGAGAGASQLSSGSIPAPAITAQQARNIASAVAWTSWWFIIGSVIGLILAMIGAAAGARKPRTYP